MLFCLDVDTTDDEECKWMLPILNEPRLSEKSETISIESMPVGKNDSAAFTRMIERLNPEEKKDNFFDE